MGGKYMLAGGVTGAGAASSFLQDENNMQMVAAAINVRIEKVEYLRQGPGTEV